ncbi:hypothetical protein Patl1_16197 [Pistacia atlantica]|uniref:Uncharacterized protein n=1 Tax=Pistacia atlantica TaxID=434234 RepID=A0ACC1BAY6_9ROSI|nr:hypothetical protein Patl1_16197 [Pistacia atlantica]
MEKLDLRVQSSLAKSIGSVVSITGALTATLYKGPAIAITSSLGNLHTEFLSQQKNWVIGGLLLAAGSFSLSLYYVFLTSLIRMYPEELMVTFLSCTFVTFQSAIFALIVKRNPNAWKLKPDVELMAIAYSVLCKHGHVGRRDLSYVSMFKPLSMIIAVVMGVTFLGETLHLGSVVGSAIIAVGFYAVIWGQAEEEKVVEKEGINSL